MTAAISSFLGVLIVAGNFADSFASPKKLNIVNSKALARFEALPMRFEPNRGQADSHVRFVSHRPDYTLFLTPAEAVLAFASHIGGLGATHPALHMKVMNANKDASIIGVEELAGTSNYFVGNDENQWRTNIPGYAKVRYTGIHHGIDLIYHGTGRQLEYDFVVSPGSSPKSIHIEMQGADRMYIDKAGDLVMPINGDKIRLLRPAAYQETSPRRMISARFVLLGRHEVGFEIGSYDNEKPLVIDPVLSYSTYLGGSGPDSASGIALDSAGNIYLTGSTSSLDFPTANPLQAINGGAPNVQDCQNRFNENPCSNAFVTKISADGSSLLYSTYIGGNSAQGDDGTGIALDTEGNAYVTGHALSRNFPTVGNQLGNGLVFVLKLNSTGSALLYSTRFARSGSDMATVYPAGIAVDSASNAYVGGSTDDLQSPTVTSGYCSPGNNLFVIKFNATASAELYSTCFATPARIGTTNPYGVALAFALDRLENAYITGFTNSLPNADVFACKLDASGKVVYATAWGGNGQDWGNAIAVDSAGSAYIAGWTTSTDFPVMNAVQPALASGSGDAFVTKLNPQGSITYSTYLGGSDYDSASGITVDDSGNIYVTGSTKSSNFPTANPLEPNLEGAWDAFVSVLNPPGSTILFSTYLGGAGDDHASAIALDASRNIYIAGSTTSPDFPTVRALQPAHNPGCVPNNGGAAFCGDAFVTKIAPLGIVGSPDGATGSFEPQLSTHLPAGFYIVEATLAQGASDGIWGLEVLTRQSAGGFDLGGEVANTVPGFGAFYVPVPQTVTATATTSFAPLADVRLSLLDSNRQPIAMNASTGTSSLQAALQPGFYIAEVTTDTPGVFNYTLALSADFFTGGPDTGGYMGPGTVGFGAFYLPVDQDVSMQMFGRNTYGPIGAGNLVLTLRDANRNVIQQVGQ